MLWFSIPMVSTVCMWMLVAGWHIGVGVCDKGRDGKIIIATNKKEEISIELNVIEALVIHGYPLESVLVIHWSL